MQAKDAVQALRSGAYDARFAFLYSAGAAEVKRQAERYEQTVDRFTQAFGEGRELAFFSAPGRTEVGGNHTDHQHGRVLASGVNLDMIAVCSPNGSSRVCVHSEGYDPDVVDLALTQVQPAENNRTAALIRGIAARMGQLGYQTGGFDAAVTSHVLQGSGLSSSAAYEVLIGTIFNHLFNDGAIGAVEIAQIGQYAENVYFGKPCGLMDQTASSVGGFVAIDFQDPAHPVVEQINFEFAQSGYALCIVNTGGNHADLTPDYAAIPAEMKQVAALLGKEVLREVEPNRFEAAIPMLREKAGDRAVLRALHFFAENERAAAEAEALRQNDFAAFLRLILESGESSFQFLQNGYSTQNPREQGLSLGLALSARILRGHGAWRVHGGGFAGTIQAFVPLALLEEYQTKLEAVFGAGQCHVLSIRPVGGVCVRP